MTGTPKKVLEYVTEKELSREELFIVWAEVCGLPYFDHISFKQDPVQRQLSDLDQAYLLRAVELMLGPQVFAVKLGFDLEEQQVQWPAGKAVPRLLQQLAADVQAGAAVAKKWDAVENGFEFCVLNLEMTQASPVDSASPPPPRHTPPGSHAPAACRSRTRSSQTTRRSGAR